jgi:ketosteroid isomerase-like protein
MKTLSVAVVLAVALPCLVLGQAKPKQAVPSAGESAIQEVTGLERAWMDASRQHDVAWFERNLAASCILTDENGVVTDKAAMIADVKAGANQIESSSYENLKVQAYGDTVVATGVSVTKGTYKGKDNSGQYPWTDTWVKRGGQWQCVASHNSKIVPK